MEDYYLPDIQDIESAAATLKDVALLTPLQYNGNISKEYDSTVYLKREDLQVVRSYKLRGAYNMMKSLHPHGTQNGVVCASAGNHAQGFAYACSHLGVKGYIYMPAPTPRQKVDQVRTFGGKNIEIILQGDTFDDALAYAQAFCSENQMAFIPPFDHPKIIEGQATVALEILQQLPLPAIDYIFVPVGGGGLISGILALFKRLSPRTKIIGVEPAGAPSMKVSLEKGVNTRLAKIDKFVDGAAVQKVGDYTFAICKHHVDDMIAIPEGKVCHTMLDLYTKDGIIVEPAGALSVSALSFFADKIKGKNVVCIVSGNNNDITRTEEIRERALLYEGLKHYFVVRFAQRAGALKEFVVDVLGPSDDITYFQYIKKNAKEKGLAVVGLELKHKEDFPILMQKMQDRQMVETYLNDNEELMRMMLP